MTEDPGPGFRAELLAALDVVEPQITGLDDLAHAVLSDEITSLIEQALEPRRVRRGLINDVLTKIDLLKADGYPAPLQQVSLSDVLAEELEKEKAAIEAATAIFEMAVTDATKRL